VLRLHGHKLGDHLAVGNVLSELLHDLGCGRDGIRRDDVRIDELQGQRDGFIAFDQDSLAHGSSRLPFFYSVTIVIALTLGGQTDAHMPQPLQ